MVTIIIMQIVLKLTNCYSDSRVSMKRLWFSCEWNKTSDVRQTKRKLYANAVTSIVQTYESNRNRYAVPFSCHAFFSN